MADYSFLGSFSSGGASSLNADLISKLKEAEKESVLFSIDNKLESITGLDAETGDALDTLGETDTLAILKAQALDLMGQMSYFDLDSGSTNAFDSVTASTTGTAAVFDAVDVGGLEPGTNNIEITQLAQRDVFQSISFNSTAKDSGMSAVDQSTLAAFQAAKISIDVIDTDLTGKSISKSIVGSDAANGSITIGGITFTNDGTAGKTTYQDLVDQINTDGTYQAEIGTDGRIIISNVPDSTTDISISGDTFDLEMDSFNYATYDFDLITDQTVTDIADVTVKSVTQLAAEINENDKFIASVETVGTDSYRLVIKSAESGQNNSLKITQTNMDLGLNDEVASDTIATPTNSIAGSITIGGITFTNDGVTVGQTTYEDLVTQINTEGTYSASIDANNKMVITAADGYSPVEVTNDSFNLGFNSTSQTQTAQNLKATVDGIDYNMDSNTLTIQGNLTMTAVEIGTSTIDIQRDTSTILTGVEAIIESYNNLVDMVDEVIGDPETVMDDISSLRTLMSTIKENLFGSYGENEEFNLFSFGLELDQAGHLSLDTTEFGDALINNYDDLKDLLLGNTTDEDLASEDSTKFLGLGTILQNYLDDLDSTNGIFTRYETSIETRQANLEKERERALELLDNKYDSMSAQFALYSSAITALESSFSGLSLMIEQSVAQN